MIRDPSVGSEEIQLVPCRSCACCCLQDRSLTGGGAGSGDLVDPNKTPCQGQPSYWVVFTLDSTSTHEVGGVHVSPGVCLSLCPYECSWELSEADDGVDKQSLIVD